MKINMNVLFIFLLILFCENSVAQSKGEKFIHSISLSEKRILEGKNEFKTKGQFPSEWKLYFKSKQGDFAVFYDWNGHEMFFKYRRNKFDVDGEEFSKNLIAGNPYLVRGEWTGYYYFPLDERGRRKATYEVKKIPANPVEFVDPNTIPVFKLSFYTEIQSDHILY